MEMEEMMMRVDEVQGVTSAQVEMSKKRDMEMAKLRRDIEVGI
jgi:hypothetical protein